MASVDRGLICAGCWIDNLCSSGEAFTGRINVVVVAPLGTCAGAGALDGSGFGGAAGGVPAFCGAVRFGVLGVPVCSIVFGTRPVAPFFRGSV